MQKYVDSAISKTCNAPNDYTVEQTKALYESLFKLGCKGGTIYRDGCRDTQVLSLKKEDAKQDPDDKIIEVEKPKKDVSPLRDRPNMTSGFTIEKNSPLGHVFTTLNMSDDGEPFELFINAGKTGSDVSSMTEALGRAVSLLLRIEASMSPAERLSMLVDQFEGISGSNPVGFGKNKVKSLPEAVAKGIEEILARQMLSKSPKNTDIVLAAMAKQDVQEKVAETPKTGVKGKKKPKPDLCPQCGEATFIREEGCQHCTSCNHSRCG
jgi:ribonucleoside-diphosphate reductase alpha chain